MSPSATDRVFQLIASHRVLFSVPVVLICLIAGLDSADKSLLASSFPMLERILHLDVATLGYFSLFANLSYSLSLPFWGWLVHKYSITHASDILAASCLGWGLSSLGIAASGSSVLMQGLFRSINGAALASILPLSQTLLVEFVPSSMRGRAFGLMGLVEKVAATVAVAAVIWSDDWQGPYVVVGVFSIATAFVSRRRLRLTGTGERSGSDDDDDEGGLGSADGGLASSRTAAEEQMSLVQIVQRIARIPAFLCLVGQGVFGGIPWDMMSFVLLLLEWKGFTKDQIVSLQFVAGIGGTVGGALGGALGDYFAYNPRGRIYVAFASVSGGVVFYGLFLFSNSYYWSLLWTTAFHVWGSWTPAAANRPICAELARNPSERAQIVAMWILLEKTSAAVFGAPLVGYLTSDMIDGSDKESLSSSEKAHALTLNIFFLSSFFWALCASFWLLMAYTYDAKSYEKLEQQEKGSIELTE